MDLSKFKTSDWLKVGGGVLFLIAYFLDWTSIDCGGSPFCSDINLSGSDFFFRGTLPWLLVVATAVLTFLLAAGVMKPSSVPWNFIFLIATAWATIWVLIYVIHPTYSGISGIGRGIGSILGLIASAVALAGSYLGYKESGGELSDFTDMNKIKGQFGTGAGGGGGSAPPPPPPPGGGAPPPPPPPPAPPAPPPPPSA